MPCTDKSTVERLDLAAILRSAKPGSVSPDEARRVREDLDRAQVKNKSFFAFAKKRGAAAAA
jgi:hypothetical protein